MKNLLLGVILGLSIFAAVACMQDNYQLNIATVTVGSGDSVWNIACAYMDDQDKHHDVRGVEYDILKANKLSYNSCLQPGQTLYIPLYRKASH